MEHETRKLFLTQPKINKRVKKVDAYKEEHIKGAVNYTSGTIEGHYKDLPKNKKIIVYCSWPNEHTSASLVAQLMDKGIKNAAALLGGTGAWKNAKYPMESEERKADEKKP